jgi:hypothetical protein
MHTKFVPTTGKQPDHNSQKNFFHGPAVLSCVVWSCTGCANTGDPCQVDTDCCFNNLQINPDVCIVLNPEDSTATKGCYFEQARRQMPTQKTAGAGT